MLSGLTLSLFLISLVNGQEDPSSVEKRLHNIYTKSYSQEVDDKVWSDFVTTLSNRSYVVSEGDTLWSLSEVFFGDGFYWSKIWSYNERLTNPHLVHIGQEIRFFTGSVDQPPGVWVGQDAAPTPENVPEGFSLVQVPNAEEASEESVDNTTSETVTPNFQQFSQSQKLYPGAPPIPPPRYAEKPVLENLPTTFESNDRYDASKYDEKGISLDIRPPVQVNPLFVGHTFLYGGEANDYPRVGELIETESGNFLVGPNDRLYFKSEQEFKIGDRLTIMGQDYRLQRNDVSGAVIRFMAQIRVTEKLDNNRYRAEVYRSLSDIKRGAWVSTENIPNFEDDDQGRMTAFNSVIVGGGLSAVSRVYGQGDVVFLDGGVNKGHKVGDILGIYKRRRTRLSSTDIPFSPTPIGQLKIFRVEPNLASAFIMRSAEEILAGDVTGSLTSQPLSALKNK